MIIEDSDAARDRRHEAAPLFQSARLKIKRAHHHVRDLNAQLTAFCNSNFYRIIVDKDAKTGQSLLKLEMTQNFPSDVAAPIIGDAIHNTRSALDHMMCDIVAHEGNVKTKYTKFPFDDSRQKLIDRINGGLIQRVRSDIIDLIVDEIRPYKDSGGDEGLCALHDLDITDKHELLIPSFTVSKVDGICVKGGKTALNNLSVTPMLGWQACLFAGVDNLEITNQGQPTVHIAFAKNNPFWGQSVIPTLLQLVESVSGILDIFERTLIARPTGNHLKKSPSMNRPKML